MGTPPTAVFVGKLTVATAAWDGGYAWLAVVLLANTVLSLFYYLRWLAPAFRTGEPAERSLTGAFAPAPWSSRTAVVAAGLSVALGLGSGLLWQVVDSPLLG